MKKILLIATVAMTMSSIAVYADNGKKPVVKKKAKIENCKKQHCCNASSCTKATCPDMPGCICK